MLHSEKESKTLSPRPRAQRGGIAFAANDDRDDQRRKQPGHVGPPAAIDDSALKSKVRGAN
jgi:hypothetical protein